ncbi:MAG: hypothetical protein ACFFBI_12015 [Promethearchaeota archaeon]
MNDEKNKLKKRIIEEMVVDHQNILEKYFDLAKQFINITTEGAINIISEERYSIEEKVLLYLIGKIYAKEAGVASTEEVGFKELMDNLGIVKGTIYPIIKRLRDKNKLSQKKQGKLTFITIPMNLVGKFLSEMKNTYLNE